MAGIFVRGPPPSYCRIRDPGGYGPRGGRDSNIITATRTAFYKLARPAVPDNQLFDATLSNAERQLAVQAIVATGQTGSPIGNSGRSLIMMAPAAVGFGQRFPRVSQQLSVRKASTNGVNTFEPICTEEDCFSTTATETSEINPKCLAHKGDQLGYAVVEYGNRNRAGNLTQVGHVFMSYHFDPPQRQRHFEITLSKANKLPGLRLRDVQFDDQEAARKTFVVWQTTRFLQSLVDPTLRFTSKSVSFANGLEQEMLDELASQRLRLTATPWPGYVQFPFGTRLYPTDKLEDFVTDDIGALYIYTDERVVYGGQSMENKARRLVLGDRLIDYSLSLMSFCPIAAVPKADLLKMEAHFIVCLYLGYLLGLRNPFLLQLSQTQPYSLNLEAFTSYFDDHSWTRITDFMKCMYSHDITLSRF